MRPCKRELEVDEPIDFAYLLDQRRILTQMEYEGRHLTQSYETYRDAFYQKRFVEVFDGFREQAWFRDRYLGEKKELNTLKPESPYYVLIEGIPFNVDSITIHNSFGLAEGVIAVYVQQHCISQQYKRDVYVNVPEHFDIDAYRRSLTEVYLMSKISLLEKDVSEIPLISLVSAKEILKRLVELSGKAVSPPAEESVHAYLKLLREEFLYCSVCSFQFDCYAAMHHHCSGHSERNFCARNIELASQPRNLSNCHYVSTEAEVRRYLTPTPEGTVMCQICGKHFKGLDYAMTHFEGKHATEADEISRKQTEFASFIKNIDFFILEAIEGTGDKRVPYFGRSQSEGDYVVYDFPHLFSGDILLD